MKSGLLDRRLTIQRPAYTINDFNEKIATWEDLITVWASKRDVSDGERVQAQQIAAHITTRFQFRWSVTAATINPTDRLYFEGAYYEIFSCKEIGRHRGIEISAAARAEGLVDTVSVSSAASAGVGNADMQFSEGGIGQALGVGSSIVAAAGSAAGVGG